MRAPLTVTLNLKPVNYGTEARINFRATITMQISTKYQHTYILVFYMTTFIFTEIISNLISIGRYLLPRLEKLQKSYLLILCLIIKIFFIS